MTFRYSMIHSRRSCLDESLRLEMVIIRGRLEALETVLFDDLLYRLGGQQHVIMLAIQGI